MSRVTDVQATLVVCNTFVCAILVSGALAHTQVNARKDAYTRENLLITFRYLFLFFFCTQADVCVSRKIIVVIFRRLFRFRYRHLIITIDKIQHRKKLRDGCYQTQILTVSVLSLRAWYQYSIRRTFDETNFLEAVPDASRVYACFVLLSAGTCASIIQ